MESCHTYVHGKFALHQFCQDHRKVVGRGFDKAHLLGLLVRTVKVQGIHRDIRSIIEERILKLGSQV